MPAQKRPLPSSASPGRDGRVEEASDADAEGGGGGGGGRSPKKLVNGAAAEARDGGPRREKDRRDDSDADAEEDEGDGQGGGGAGDEGRDSESSQSDGEKDEFLLVKLMDIRKEVQCPICLGIIRKTRTVMECLHRFCRDCIDKSMRLGNNECPACRAHCASRRSLRDDPNYDALILALYPDIDKYEEEELSISEVERTRNKKIQESIAETFRRQTEALVKKRSAAKAIDLDSSRKTRGYMRSRRRGRTSSPDIVPTDFGEEAREENGNDGSLSSVDDHHSPDARQKRARRWPMPRRSPVKTTTSIENGTEDNDNSGGARDILATSPLRGEMLAWGKNGTRSQTRHGNAVGSSGRTAKAGRVTRLVDQLRIADDEFDSKFNLYLLLLPLDGETMPKLERPYLSCQPTLSIQHLCQFIALQLSRQPNEVEIYVRKNSMDDCLATNNSSTDETKPEHYPRLERLWEEKSLSELHASLATSQGDLELLYSLNVQG